MERNKNRSTLHLKTIGNISGENIVQEDTGLLLLFSKQLLLILSQCCISEETCEDIAVANDSKVHRHLRDDKKIDRFVI